MHSYLSEDFDIAKIAQSGQCFRLNKQNNRYCLIAQRRVLYIYPLDGGAILDCDEQEYDALWRDYFDLDTEYRSFRNAIDADDDFLQRAVAYGKGIRILKQDLWEMLVTFIISQQKNIPAIQKAVEVLSERCGDLLLNGDQCLHAFPTAQQLAALSLNDLNACSLGYRSKYIQAAAQMVAHGDIALEAMNALSDDNLLKTLLTIPGVGSKIANCVMLFGYHRLNGFPKDVWIKRIIDNEYGGSFNERRYGGYEGVIQQYMFYYARSHAYRDHAVLT